LAFYFFCVGSPKGCHAPLFPKPNPRRQKQQMAVEAFCMCILNQTTHTKRYCFVVALTKALQQKIFFSLII